MLIHLIHINWWSIVGDVKPIIHCIHHHKGIIFCPFIPAK